LAPAFRQVLANDKAKFPYQLTSQIPTEAEQYVFKGEHRVNDTVSITGLYLYQNTDEAHSHFWGEEFAYARVRLALRHAEGQG
jgi:hypothetical protein